MGVDDVATGNLNAEAGVGEGLRDDPFHFKGLFFFGHGFPSETEFNCKKYIFETQNSLDRAVFRGWAASYASSAVACGDDPDTFH